MSFTLGVFDVFGSAVPGAAYLAVVAFVLDRLGWGDAFRPLQHNATLAAIGFAVLSYAVGVATYGISRWVGAVLSRRRPGDDAVTIFLARSPSAAGRPFVTMDRFLLLAKIELVNKEAALEISRVRANATMLRGLVPPCALGALATLVDLVTADHHPGLLLVAVLLGILGVLAHRRGQEMSRWAHQSTLETAYWIPEIDQAGPAPTGTP